MAIKAPKKLIEVALPLDEINKAAAREKSIRHGHPSTLHLWWARRPLAAARAVLFAQLVNDPSEWRKPDGKKLTKREAEEERKKLFKLITELVQWENTNNETILAEARRLIRESWRQTCELNKGEPGFDPEKLPPFHDPFAGGGAIPLEAQRLGLEAHASDLNPVAVLINKAMIEIPPKFAGRPPVGPLPPGEKQTKAKATEDWSGAKGLAEDVRRYGAWMREEAFKRIGHLYPKVKITKEMVKERPDLKKYEGQELTVIAWLWARTVASPNPAAGGAHTPLTSTFWLSTKPHSRAWAELVVTGNEYRFRVRTGTPENEAVIDAGTKAARGSFRCVYSAAPITPEHIRREGVEGRLGTALLAIVADAGGKRVYLSPVQNHEESASQVPSSVVPATALPERALGFRTQNYGLTRHRDLFTQRQQVFLSTFSSLTQIIRARVESDAVTAMEADIAREYAAAVATYLAFGVSKAADYNSSLVMWSSSRDQAVHTFSRHALPMVWDFTEVNPFAMAAGDFSTSITGIARTLAGLPSVGSGSAKQGAAQETVGPERRIISTDPPYYDNIGYADLSDYFYIWLRKSLIDVYPRELATLLVPKSDELIAAPHRHGSAEEAEKFFLRTMSEVIAGMRRNSSPVFPVTIYYAFKQADGPSDGVASTGWEVFLDAIMNSEFEIVGTWPLRTEKPGRIRELDSNALAASIVLVCRQRDRAAASVSRRDFLRELSNQLPDALATMIGGDSDVSPIAPVDLAQAAIGPGMAIFSRYKAVLEADGSPMSVQDALIHINKAIDDYFAHAEGDMDADTRFCVDWFQQYGFSDGPFGQADVLARAKGTAVDGVDKTGVLKAGAGKVRLLRVKEYPSSWDPLSDDRLPIWEACHQLCRALQESESEAGTLLTRMPEKTEPIRQLAYRLYTVCERKGWAEEARAYNELVTSWPAIVEESRKTGLKGEQLRLA